MILAEHFLQNCPLYYQANNIPAVSGVGSSPALATCETSQVLLAGLPGGFSRVLSFSPTY